VLLAVTQGSKNAPTYLLSLLTSSISDGPPLLFVLSIQQSRDPRRVNTAKCNQVINTIYFVVRFIDWVSSLSTGGMWLVVWLVGGFSNLVVTVSMLTQKQVLRRPHLSRRRPSSLLLCGWYTCMCMRARSDVTRQNCISCSNHTFGRVIMHFADRVWGKRSSQVSWMLRWLWPKFVCTAHSAHITCAECVHCSLCSYYLRWMCALLTVLISLLPKYVHRSLCSYNWK
jgi:hypothetical protein